MAEKMLKDKVVLVTGAGRGIGRGIAILCAQYGAKVVVNDLGAQPDGVGKDVGPAQEVVNEIRKIGGEAIVNGDSVADWDGAQRMVQQAVDTFGKIDGVVNNAGILRDRIFHKMTPEDFDAVVKVHLYGSFYVSRAACDHFRKQQSGAYVHLTSTSGLIGNYGQANYGAAKLGIVALSKVMALDMQRYHVRSNCVSPFAWSRLIGTIPTNSPEEEARVNKMKQMTPEKIAPMCVYLLSDASQNVNGQVFAVRKNEIFLMSQNRPLRSAHAGEGWTPEAIRDRVIPAFKSDFYPLERSPDVFSWDPM